METWKKIESYPNYMVSNTGKVRCLAYGKSKKETDLKLTLDKSGNLVCNLTNGLGRKTYRVDYMVLQCFSPIEDVTELEQEPYHIDGDRNNINANNLAWITKVSAPVKKDDKRRKRGKAHHKFGVKTPELTRVKMSMNHNQDKKHPNYKLTDKQVYEIKKRRFEGEDLETLAIEFGQSIANISYITTGQRRKKIAVEYTMNYRVRNR